MKSATKGFTLTEVALAMAIIGFVLGAIWVAATDVYAQHNAEKLVRDIQVFQQNARTLFQSQSTVAFGANGAYDLTDQTCPNPAQCSTLLMMTAGVFPTDFVSPTSLMSSGASVGLGGQLYNTPERYPIWTGVYDCALYFQQQGGQGAPPCSGSTVIELDVFKLSPFVCTHVLTSLINFGVDGLVDVSTPQNAWGPITGGLFGHPTVPTSIPVTTAITACQPGISQFSYVTGNNSYIWMVFEK